jgi:chromosome segregation ATPase
MDEDLKQLLETMRQENAAAHAETRRELRQENANAHVETRRELRQENANAHVETRRHFEVVAERLETKIDLVTEGVIHANERIDRLDAKVDTLAEEMADEFNDIRSMIKFSHHDLDRRLRSLEDVVTDLQARVERLESSTH